MATADLKGAEYREAYGEAAWSQILGTYSMCLDKVYRFIIGVLVVFFLACISNQQKGSKEFQNRKISWVF